MMGSSQGQSDNTNTNNTKLYERHPVKMLNMSLILYLALGGFLFDALGEFQEPLKASEGPAKSVDLRELRLKSVRRMWNITNQLNILYESNWTQLVLDELVEFERQFLESLADVERRGASGEEPQQKSNRDEEKSGRANSKSRTISIKKSLSHSLATITTIGTPPESLRSEWGKLATALYGALGIPLLVFTVARTGHQLAQSAANSLLVIRHYCISMPLHYICCCCSLYQCFRWLSWCCCCCCCTYLCCLSDKERRKCCDKSRAPKLRLIKSKGDFRRRAAGAASRYPNRAAYVIGSSHLANGGSNKVTQGDNFGGHQQKSVRFSNQQQHKLLSAQAQDNNRLEVVQQQEAELEREEESPIQSPGLFITSLSVLSLYLAFGALIYSRTQRVSIVDAIFVCYDLLSVSRLPSSFGLEPPRNHRGAGPEKLANLYQSLKANWSGGHKLDQIVGEASDLFQFESLAWQTLYLICGLNLISMCSQFAQMWLSDNFDETEELIEGLEPTPSALCNGYGPSSAASFNGPGGPFANCYPQFDNQILPAGSKGTEPQYMVQTLMAAQDTGHLVPSTPDDSMQQQQQQQVDLAELFVVSQETSPIGIEYSGHHHHQPQQQHLVASDASFASDRTTERGSLCQLHQASTGASAASSTAGAIYGTQPPSYGHRHQLTLRSRKEHLYLADQCMAGLELQHQKEGQEEEEQEEDEYEMDRMLKTCINGNQRSSSSSTHLSHSNGYLSSNTLEGYGKLGQQQQQQLEGSSSAGRKLRLLEANGCEQDNSLNTIDTTTNSNTISSVSSRTVKLPQHIHIHNGIGFILNGGTTTTTDNNKQ